MPSTSSVRRAAPAILGVVVLAAAVLLVFSRVGDFGFLLYDDNKYVTDNPVVPQGLTAGSVGWAFGFHSGMWQPLTWLTYMAEVSAFGVEPGPMHLTNMVLHLLVGLAAWRFLARATGRPRAAFVVALLFLLHPLQVQSVAWIAERKGLLAALMGLLVLDGWTAWARDRSRGGYARAHLFFILGLMAKPILLPLPVVLIALDAWLYRRPVAWREKIPLFCLSVIGGVVSVAAQGSAGALRTIEESGLVPRLESAVTAWGLTLRRFVAPVDLAGFYPFRDEHAPGAVLVWATLLIVLTAVAWSLRLRRPAWTAGWAWWLLLQAPTVGLVQFGAQQTADRFSYLPLLGLLTVVVLGIDWQGLAARLGRAGAPALAVLTVAAVMVTGFASAVALEPWRDTVSLFEHSIARGGGSALAHQNLSMVYARGGDLESARRHSDRAVALEPAGPLILFQQANLRYVEGDLAGAEEFYRRSLAVEPGAVEAWIRLAMTCERAGAPQRAAEAWERAVALRPDDPDLRRRLENAQAGDE